MVRALLAMGVGLALGALVAPLAVPLITGRPPPDAVSRAIGAQLTHTPADPVTSFYAGRRDRPLWEARGRLRPEAEALVAALKSVDADDLNPASYGPDRLASEVAATRVRPDPALLARTDIDLSHVFAAWVGDLHRPQPQAAWRFVDPAVRLPSTDPAAILTAAARAPDLATALSDARRMNPIYEGLRAALVAARVNRDPRAALIAANLERARALPTDLGPRYILVNPAAETLWFDAAGAAPRTMPVVVGKTDNQTPSMIGLVRFALFNPYWNVPPDLVREKIAPSVLREGLGFMARRRFEALADFSPNAAVVDPAAVDWSAVATGARVLRVRQLPGGDNMMGQVKFMLPNSLGIYLHDTPLRGLFAADVRTDSHGCVRLKDAARLAQWIFGHPVAPSAAGGPDQRADVSPPIPVYILYLTVQPSADGGVVFLPDIYARDPALLAALAARPARSG